MEKTFSAEKQREISYVIAVLFEFFRSNCKEDVSTDDLCSLFAALCPSIDLDFDTFQDVHEALLKKAKQ